MIILDTDTDIPKIGIIDCDCKSDGICEKCQYMFECDFILEQIKEEYKLSVEEAIKWLDKETMIKNITEIENSNGIDTVDIIVSKIDEACKVACTVMRQYLADQVVKPM